MTAIVKNIHMRHGKTDVTFREEEIYGSGAGS